MVIPYNAVLYDAETAGRSPTRARAAGLRARARSASQRIGGDRAVLSRGPPVGREVVTVGSQELFGTEYEVEED